MSIYKEHLDPLYDLDDAGRRDFANMLGSHFVSHGSLDRATFEKYIDEARAVQS